MSKVSRICRTVLDNNGGTFEPGNLFQKGCISPEVYERWNVVATHTFLNFLLGLPDEELQDIEDAVHTVYLSHTLDEAVQTVDELFQKCQKCR